MDFRPISFRVCSSLASETPLWSVTCHSRKEEKMLSPLLIIPSPLPPRSGLSYSASAMNPLRSMPAGGSGCGVKLPNNSWPLSTTPLPLRSKASQASSEPVAVHDNFSLKPSLLRSKFTPPAPSVRSIPLPRMSITMGLVGLAHLQVHGSMPYAHSRGGHMVPSHSGGSLTLTCQVMMPDKLSFLTIAVLSTTSTLTS